MYSCSFLCYILFLEMTMILTMLQDLVEKAYIVENLQVLTI